MITVKQREELEKIKPPRYRERVQEHLSSNGYEFSLETIQKVYSCKRNNLTIAKAIIYVFHNHMKEKELINKNINKVINEINKNNT